METPVTFKNKNGEKLFGIVHTPEKSTFKNKRVGVNILVPGIKYRVAPNRLNVKIARQLCELGYYVLRFDPMGIGDSEGELPDSVLIADIGEKIMTGLFVPDTISANDFFRTEYNLSHLVLIGNCGGAITSLLTSIKDRKIDALCLIDTPMDIRSSKTTFADKVVQGGRRADWLFAEYMKRIFSLKAWYRFLTMKSEYKALYKVISMKLLEKISFFRKSTLFDQHIEKLCQENNLNIQFFEGVEKHLKRKNPILFVLAGNDPATEIFQQYFQNGYFKERIQNREYNNLVEIKKIENANHIYTLTEWQDSLLNNICNWLDSQNFH